MDNSFFPRTWRSKAVKATKEDLLLPLGEYDLLRVKKKFEKVIADFIQGIFNYEKIKIDLVKEDNANPHITAYSGQLVSDKEGHTKLDFALKLFDDQLYKFSVTNIPATTESRHIRIFFRVLMEYLSYYHEIIKNNMPIVDGELKASQEFIAKSDIWLYNIERTIIVEYIYNLFNTYDEDYRNTFTWSPNPLRYDVDLINTTLDFAYELSTKTVENKEIYCGFIFHDKESEVRLNSARSIKLKKKLNFGDFAQLKNYLEISNGQNVFFNVTKDKITHVFIIREKLNEIHLNPISNGKTFESRPLILSVQGNGKIYFLEGRSDHNKILLQITNSHPVIRDINFIKKFIYESLEKHISSGKDQLTIFSKWIMSLSQKKHGASLLFYDVTEASEQKLVKTVAISFDNNDFLGNNDLQHDLTLLDSLVSPDGAVIFSKKLMPTHIGTILPIQQTAIGTTGGSRHNSVSNFTKAFSCLGIVISEDGPITIFENGKELIKF